MEPHSIMEGTFACAVAFFVVVLGAAAISVGNLQPSIDSPGGNHADRVTVRVDALTDADRDAIRKIFTPRNPNTQVRRLRIGIKPKGPRAATVMTSSWYNFDTFFEVRHLVEKHNAKWVKISSELIRGVRL